MDLSLLRAGPGLRDPRRTRPITVGEIEGGIAAFAAVLADVVQDPRESRERIHVCSRYLSVRQTAPGASL